ncbi:MAG: M48 family metalloprotease [Acidobacteria bacterium]|nr:M48 family metalloprotease [Acidobacteriota bacterium]
MSRDSRSANTFALITIAWILTLVFVMTPFTYAQRTQFKEGRNIFTPQQDVELGQQVAQDAEAKLAMLNDQRVDDYLNRLGRKLAAFAPGEKFPYQFKAVNDANINAFALPGGFLYINRGTIEAADNEAQLAGVLAHEIGHVALRHGTSQATKAQLAQAPLAILGTLLGGRSTGSILARVGAEFLADSVLLKYSRDAERQADLVGTQILYDANYDPRAMATFFDKLEGGGRGTDFFSSHPNPDNRQQGINAEIGKLGSVSRDAISDSRDFRRIQQYVRSLPAAPKAGESQSQTSSSGKIYRPARPSSRYVYYDGENISLSYPDNWKEYETDQGLTLAPEGGGNETGLAYGVTMSIFVPNTGGRSSVGLREATDQLIQDLQRSNSGMQVTRDQGTTRVGGKTALSTILTGNSPAGGRERDWLVTLMLPEGLMYIVFVAPEQEFPDYQRAFQQVLNSIKFYN